MNSINFGPLHIYKAYSGYSIKTHGHTNWSIHLELFGWRLWGHFTLEKLSKKKVKWTGVGNLK